MAVFKKEREEPVSPRPSYKESAEVVHTKSIIGKTLLIKGDMIADEDVMIEGKIEGKIHGKHRIVVAKEGIINADIVGKEVVIRGRVNGNVKCSYKVEIVPGGILNGNIKSEKVVLAEGAVFKGNINMGLETEDSVKTEKPKSIETKDDKEKKES